ncbi:hypothetical protein BC332_07442 [Capsicum chinense]|uniref:Uncharacterized protein n=1 Tax=Capsicum annuum TaxID=4072 RepID=A0A2G2ZWR5_CAPAN|nr:hypothetical protein FXO38_23632 [Capsicum annuum]PHT86404.1 hypothetical protein T459_08510 [Capsicum annuum]PHU22335.1 hypothetical protein BC332_07442 [Capsicum chinense]
MDFNTAKLARPVIAVGKSVLIIVRRSQMMMFEEMRFCGDLDFFPAPLKKVKVEVVAPQNRIEPDSVVDDDYSDEEIDVY